MSENISHSVNSTNLADILERVLDKGIVIAGDILIQIADIVDVYRTGQVAIADKGWAALGKKSETLAGGDAIKRYMNDMKKWKAF